MAFTRGSRGKVEVFEDFLPHYDVNTSTSITTVVPGTGRHNLGHITVCAVNEGSYTWTDDESNGVLAYTTDTGNDDNVCLIAGHAWLPSVQGPLVLEARFK